MEIKVLALSSKGNCIYVSDGKTGLLLDCGLPVKEIKRGLNFGLTQVEACLLTHCHQDHAKAAKDIIKAGIDLYASPATVEALGLTGHRVMTVKSMEKFEVGSLKILAFDAVHDVETLGFLLASPPYKVLYLIDSAYCKYRFTGLTHLLVGCNYSMDILRQNVADGALTMELKNRIIRSHMGLETLKGMLKANDLSQVEAVYLLHLSDGNSDAERFKKEIRALTGKPVYIGAGAEIVEEGMR